MQRAARTFLELSGASGFGLLRSGSFDGSAAWPPQAIYSLAFFVFWMVIAVASAVTLWLASQARTGTGGEPR